MLIPTENLPTHDPEAMKKLGFKSVQMWVYDTSAPGFAEQMARESKLLAQSESEQEVLNWMEDNIDWPTDDSGIKA